MTQEGVKAAVAYLVEAWQMGTPLRELPEEGRPKSLVEAYRLQDKLAEALGFDVGGWKVGATGAVARKLLKARGPFAGRVFAARIVDSGVTLPGAAYRVRGLEAEFAFRLKTALPARKRPYTRAEVIKAVGEMMPAIEVVDSRYTDFLAVGLKALIADQGMNAALVLGKPIKRWQAVDLKTHKVRMTVNGKVVGEGKGADVLGHPLASLLWLVNHLRQRGGLAAGQVVTTGTCTGLFRAQPHDQAVAEFGRLGRVAVNFVA
jgi:2-keto-4-pentenoate hydratase